MGLPLGKRDMRGPLCFFGGSGDAGGGVRPKGEGGSDEETLHSRVRRWRALCTGSTGCLKLLLLEAAGDLGDDGKENGGYSGAVGGDKVLGSQRWSSRSGEAGEVLKAVLGDGVVAERAKRGLQFYMSGPEAGKPCPSKSCPANDTCPNVLCPKVGRAAKLNDWEKAKLEAIAAELDTGPLELGLHAVACAAARRSEVLLCAASPASLESSSLEELEALGVWRGSPESQQAGGSGSGGECSPRMVPSAARGLRDDDEAVLDFRRYLAELDVQDRVAMRRLGDVWVEEQLDLLESLILAARLASEKGPRGAVHEACREFLAQCGENGGGSNSGSQQTTNASSSLCAELWGSYQHHCQRPLDIIRKAKGKTNAADWRELAASRLCTSLTIQTAIVRTLTALDHYRCSTFSGQS